jgi:hypothetical protein
MSYSCYRKGTYGRPEHILKVTTGANVCIIYTNMTPVLTCGSHLKMVDTLVHCKR